jgi:hypothetical protein
MAQSAAFGEQAFLPYALGG